VWPALRKVVAQVWGPGTCTVQVWFPGSAWRRQGQGGRETEILSLTMMLRLSEGCS
jgi:hypothetical protein